MKMIKLPFYTVTNTLNFLLPKILLFIQMSCKSFKGVMLLMFLVTYNPMA